MAEIDWPKNIVLQGLMSFPIYSEQNIVDLKAWREKKDIAKPKYDDKIGVTLILDQANYDKARTYLIEVYLPFVKTLFKDTNGKKGIDPDLVDELLEQAKTENWLLGTGKNAKPNIFLRSLSPKDKENLGDFEGVAKVKTAGPYPVGSPIVRKALIKENGERTIVKIDELVEDGVLPEGRTDSDALWWGAGWNFQTSLRLNAYDSANHGVTAYSQSVYLLPHLGLPGGGNGGDQQILEDGDDWE